MTALQSTASSANTDSLQRISTLIIGTEGARREDISNLIRDVSENVNVFPVPDGNIDFLEQESFGLILIVDAAEETLRVLDEILARTDRSVHDQD